MQDKKGIKNGSDTSRTKLDHEARSPSLSRSAKQRLKWMEHFKKYRNARLTCRHFGISPDTFYLWKRRFNPDNLLTLEDNPKTRKPHRVRLSRHLTSQSDTIKQLKAVNSKLGKVRIAKILKEMGYAISPATITRILKKQKPQTQ